MNGILKTAIPFLALACTAFAKERQVGLFYFLWLGEHGRTGPYDVSKILAADPDAGHNPNSPVWGGHGEIGRASCRERVCLYV